MEKEIKELIAKILRVEISHISDDLEIGELAEWDSLNHLNIIHSIEQKYSIHFEQSDLADMETVSDIISVAKELARA